MRTNEHGFSLIELLVVMSIIGVIASLGFGAYKVAQVKNQSATVVNAVVSGLRRAQIQSQANDGDLQWGVRIQNNNVIVFKGATYASRVTSFDESYSLPSGFIYTGLSEIVFSKLYGYPVTAGTISIAGRDGTVQPITINAKGTISY